MPIRSLSALILASLTLAYLLIQPLPTPAQQKTAAPKRVAVLVGTDKYAHISFQGLKYCEKDMLKLKETLEPLGFKVVLLLGSGSGASEATRKNIFDTLINDDESNTKYAFRGLSDREDLALVALDGQGQQSLVKHDGKEAEVPFNCPKDATPEAPETLISINDILTTLNRGKGQALLLVDTGRRYGSLRDERAPVSSANGLSLHRGAIKDLRSNVGGMFACADRQDSIEHESAGGGHSLFYFSIIDAIKKTPRDEAGVVTWEDLVPRIRKKIVALSSELRDVPERDRQKPQSFGNFTTSIVIVPPK